MRIKCVCVGGGVYAHVKEILREKRGKECRGRGIGLEKKCRIKDSSYPQGRAQGKS